MKRLVLHGHVVAVYAPQAYTPSEPQQPTGGPAVASIGIDLDKRESQLCILSDGGELCFSGPSATLI